MRLPTARSLLLAAVLLATFAATTGAGQAATSNVTITATIPNATIVNLVGCPAGARTFGTVLPDTPSVTGADCSVQFGASGTTSRLRVRQTDGTGVGMHTWTNGAGDAGWGPGGIRDIASGTDWLAGTVVTATGAVLRGGNRSGEYAIARLTSAGALDTVGYGGGDGYASVDPTGTAGFNHAHVLDAFPDGSAILGGHSTFAQTEATFVRFTAAGLLDTTWGTGDDGITNFNITANDDEPWDIQVQPDGSVLVAGHSDPTTAWVARLDPDGLLDLSFGGGDGIATATAGGAVNYGRIAVDPATQAIYWSGQGGTTALFAKFDRTGVLVTSWGVSGLRTVDVAGMGSDIGGQPFVDSQGRLVAVGDGNGALGFIVRIDAAGAPDGSFGPGGVVTHDPWGARGIWFDTGEIVRKGGDRFCTGGNGEPVTSGTWRLYAVCFNADGSLDTSFGAGGFAFFAPSNVQSHDAGMWSRDGALYLGGGAGGRLVTVKMGGDTQSIPDYVHPGTNFASAGGAFGACLRGVTSATNTWTLAPVGNCSGDGAHWNGIPSTSAGAGTQVATAASGVGNAQVDLRFGLKSSATAKGSFEAPVTFEVVGP